MKNIVTGEIVTRIYLRSSVRRRALEIGWVGRQYRVVLNRVGREAVQGSVEQSGKRGSTGSP